MTGTAHALPHNPMALRQHANTPSQGIWLSRELLSGIHHLSGKDMHILHFHFNRVRSHKMKQSDCLIRRLVDVSCRGLPPCSEVQDIGLVLHIEVG